MPAQPITVRDALRHGVAALTDAGVDNPTLDARLLLAHAMAVDQATLLLHRDAAAPIGPYQALLARRARREPVALIIGRQGFWSMDFAVSRDTLIPRPDSETLIEAAIAARPDRGAVRRVLDLGTGTGCLLLAALSEFPAAWGLGVDLVPSAAALAARNARALGLHGRAALVCADWAASLDGRFDLVLSNPPYIDQADLAALMPEVAQFEPASALDGGPDGLAAYRALTAALPRVLAPGGLAVFELGAGQADAVGALLHAAGYRTWLRPDLAGIGRAIAIEAAPG